MRLDDERDSDNVEDARGQGGGFGIPGLGGGGLSFGGGRMGCGTLVIVAVLALVFGINPLSLLGGGSGGPTAPTEQQIGQPAGPSAPAPGQRSEMDRFVSRVLATTEDSWDAQFKKEVGQAYQRPKLVLFSGSVRSGCGAAEAAMGPFYCPADGKVYLDQSFFDELSQRFGAKGDFAAAYVIAHEIGHHVQNLLGISEQAQRAQSRASKTEGNAISVRVELQADCLAGVWASANRQLLDPGDIEEAMRAATAIGDDTLQRASTGMVMPENFTHGSAAQRTRWFMQGFDKGSIRACDTFAADAL